MSTRPCPYCAATVVRIAVQGTVRAVDATPSPTGSLEVDLDAGRAWPTKHEGPTFSGSRHHLHRDTCTAWAGPGGG